MYFSCREHAIQGAFIIFVIPLSVANGIRQVHKCYLLRESSAFGDMFALPLVGQLSATSPIHLYDTADEFRDLLWALYAL